MRKDCSSPFESKLIFSYSCERCFEDKKRQKRDHWFNQASKRNEDVHRWEVFCEELWIKRPEAADTTEVSSGQKQIQNKAWDGELTQKNIWRTAH